ncbi:ABC transporter ATP-binding protein [Streptomyces sp. 8L]|uniref:ABC transporter ATP-binding protein n=1 Tax=Streptomyces sp. 8L TaxID=2877242 RepID=UPI001CD3CCB0|nr:ABC transporter ATP-binding protein [Streptomyces sp. 8L]MCA1217422.1 ABC transporter ATP-binding protein/permease [Streptomyces sp. 8L]
MQKSQCAERDIPRSSPLDHQYQGENPLRTLAYLFRPDRGKLTLSVLVFAFKHIPVWLLPLITANVIDVVVSHRSVAELWINTGGLGAILLLNFPLAMLFARYTSASIRRMGRDVRSALCRRMQYLSIGYHARVSAGVLQTKIVRDVESIETMVQQGANLGLGALMTLFGGLAVIAFKVPVVLPVFVIVVPVAALLVRKMRSRIRSNNEEFRLEIERLSSRVGEMTTLIPITRAHGLERTALHRVDDTLKEVRTKGFRLDLLNSQFGSMSWILLNTMAVACLAGAALVAYYGRLGISPGDVVMISSFFTTLTASFTTLMNLTPIISKGLESVRSIGEVLQAPDLEINEGKTSVDGVDGRIDFQDMAYRYPEAAEDSVRGFDLTVRPGETVALVGASGAGKSTILNLLIGFIRPTEGRILLDGRDMSALDLRTYRRFLSVVPQESILFEGTIRENVTYGLEGGADEETLRESLAAANAMEFVERLPQGLDTVVGQRGARLSGGQKQRLAIARALIRDPRVLVLDEATSALDNRSEALIQDALSRLVRGRTVFVVAHRLTTIQSADRIVVMDRGRVVESGTHHELLALGGTYATTLQPRRIG